MTETKKEHSTNYYFQSEPLPQHQTYYEEDFHAAVLQSGNVEKQIKTAGDLKLGVWCENMQVNHQGYYFSPVVRLHPQKDLLVVAHPGGKICKWSYQPQLQFVEGVQTNQHFINDLAIVPKEDWVAVVAQHLWGIEFRQVDDLERIHFVQNEWTQDPFEDMNALAVSPDGKWMITDVSKNCLKEGLSTHLCTYNLETQKPQMYHWNEFHYYPFYEYLSDNSYDSPIRFLFSPDQRNIVLYVHGQGEPILCILSSFLVDKDERTYSIEYVQSCGRYRYHITDFACNREFTHIVYFRTSYFRLNTGAWKRPVAGWIGDLVAVSPRQQKEFWTVSIDATLTGSKASLTEEYYPGGYASKVLVGKREVVCTAPGGMLLFFDLHTGKFKRKLDLHGDSIYALDWHSSGKQIRVATDRMLQMIPWE